MVLQPEIGVESDEWQNLRKVAEEARRAHVLTKTQPIPEPPPPPPENEIVYISAPQPVKPLGDEDIPW